MRLKLSKSSNLDELHLRKIDLADEIFVVDVDNYVGESTTREINYAVKLEKPIRLFTEDPLGRDVTAHYLKVKGK